MTRHELMKKDMTQTDFVLGMNNLFIIFLCKIIGVIIFRS